MAVALHLGELALDLALHEAGALLELGRPRLGLLDLGDEALQLLDDLLDRLLVEAHLFERRHELAVGLGRLDLDLLLARVGLRLFTLLGEIGLLLVEALHLVDEADDAAVRLFLVELLVVALAVLDELLHTDLVLAELLAELDDLAHRDRRIEDGGVHLELAALDALGDLDLALAREERDAPHLAEVHANRIVRLRVVVDVLFFAVALRDDELLFARFFVGDALRRDLDLRRAVDDLDVLVAEGTHHVVELIRGDVGGERVVHLVVGEKTLRFARFDELLEGLLVLLAAIAAARITRRRRRRRRVSLAAPGPRFARFFRGLACAARRCAPAAPSAAPFEALLAIRCGATCASPPGAPFEPFARPADCLGLLAITLLLHRGPLAARWGRLGECRRPRPFESRHRRQGFGAACGPHRDRKSNTGPRPETRLETHLVASGEPQLFSGPSAGPRGASPRQSPHRPPPRPCSADRRPRHSRVEE